MATKGILIGDALPNQSKGSGTTTTIFICIRWHNIIKLPDGSYQAELVLWYYESETAEGASGKPLTWVLPSSYMVTVTEAEWDSNAKAPNELFYDKLETALNVIYTSVTKKPK